MSKKPCTTCGDKKNKLVVSAPKPIKVGKPKNRSSK